MACGSPVIADQYQKAKRDVALAEAEAKTQALEEHSEGMEQNSVSRNTVLLTSNEDIVRQWKRLVSFIFL